MSIKVEFCCWIPRVDYSRPTADYERHNYFWLGGGAFIQAPTRDIFGITGPRATYRFRRA